VKDRKVETKTRKEIKREEKSKRDFVSIPLIVDSQVQVHTPQANSSRFRFQERIRADGSCPLPSISFFGVVHKARQAVRGLLRESGCVRRSSLCLFVVEVVDRHTAKEIRESSRCVVTVLQKGMECRQMAGTETQTDASSYMQRPAGQAYIQVGASLPSVVLPWLT
jgi:hypothetical protein